VDESWEFVFWVGLLRLSHGLEGDEDDNHPAERTTATRCAERVITGSAGEPVMPGAAARWWHSEGPAIFGRPFRDCLVAASIRSDLAVCLARKHSVGSLT
jgi:hypothetical protein